MRDAGYEVGVTAEDAPACKDVGYDVVPRADDTVIEVGRTRLHTILTPGPHARARCASVVEGSPVLFSGDTLFPGGPGNTTFDGGDFATIIRSIDDRLFALPADTHRAARPRRRHHDRRRAAPPPGVDRPGLVTVDRALPADQRPVDDTPSTPPTCRRRRIRDRNIPATAWIEAPRRLRAARRRPARPSRSPRTSAGSAGGCCGGPGRPSGADARYLAVDAARPDPPLRVPAASRTAPATASAPSGAASTPASGPGRKTLRDDPRTSSP